MATSHSTEGDLIVRTRLNRPPPPADLLLRSRLTDLLEANPDRCLTLVSAPAGYGKSTLVSRWVEATALPGVWLSLDEEDNDLRKFLIYFIAAVRTHSPRACRRTRELLDAAPDLPPPAVLSTYLANDLQAIKRPFILVVDDYHRIHQPAVHDVVDQLLRHPPRPVHLVLVTRRDPPLSLTALRAQGRMVEIRQQSLRFTRDETRAALLMISGVSIGDDTLAHLHRSLEGWITGLRLVCLTLGNQEDSEGYLARLDIGASNVQEYLVEEVLKMLSPDFQHCLLSTSILNRFCAPLCEAVCWSDAAGAGNAPRSDAFSGVRFLRDLNTANLFAIVLDPSGKWFRYHHLFQQLLRDLLQQRVTEGDIRALHGRASRWFASHGLTDEALEHAMAAGEPDLAADIVEARRLEVLNTDKWPDLAGWHSRLPEEVVWQRPELLLGEAWLCYYRFNIPALARIMERLDELLGDGGANPAWDGELSMFKSYICYWQGQTAEMLVQVARAQETLPATHDLMRADAEIYFGLAHHMAGQKETAIDALTSRIREQPDKEGLLVTRQVITLAFIHLLAGNLQEAAVYSRQLGELARSTSPVYIESWSSYLLGCCHFQSGNWKEAESCFRWLVKNRYVVHTAVAMSSLIGLGLTCCFQGRPGESAQVEQRLREYAAETKDPVNLALAESGRARIRLLRGETESGCPAPEIASMTTAFIFLEVSRITHCRRLIARGSGKEVARAEGTIEALRKETAAIHNTFQLIDLAAMKAVACHKLEQHDEAACALEQALELAAPGGWIRPFVELGPPMAELLAGRPTDERIGQIERILAAFPEPQGPQAAAITVSPPSAEPPVDPLTNRELDVLELLAERLYDKEIAHELHISVPTVKTHLRHIYDKLAVANRRQAVVKAEQLGLLNSPGQS